MPNVLLQRHLDCLRPIDEEGLRDLRALQEMEIVRCKWTKPRNIKLHKLFFALLNLVFENTDGRYKSTEHLLTQVKIGIGHADLIVTKDGKEYWHPLSISFAKMDDTAFRSFWDRAVNFIIAEVVPFDKKELEKEVFEMLGYDLESAR